MAGDGDDEAEQAPRRPWLIGEFFVLVSLIAAFGLSLLVPGLILRAERVPTPAPLLRVPLCPASAGAGWASSASPCSGAATSPQEVAFVLHDTMLLNGVAYAPVVVLSEAAGPTLIDVAVFDSAGGLLLKAAKTLRGGRGDGAPDAGPGVQELRQSGIDPLVNEYVPTAPSAACSDPRSGCALTLQRPPIREFLLSGSRFVIPKPGDVFLETFAPNLTAVVTALSALPLDARAASVAAAAPPDVLVSFRQVELSYVQGEGVKFIVLGGAVVLAAFGALCAHHCKQLRKTGKRRRRSA